MSSIDFEHIWHSRQEIVRLQQDRLRQLLREIIPANPFWTRRFHDAGIPAESIRSVDDLLSLPVTTKSMLVDDQAQYPPYGSNLTYPLTSYSRLHQTSGTTGVPLRWLDTPASWNWINECWRQIYHMIGLRPDDRLFFPFSFGPFIGFWAAFEGATRIGNLCIAGGGMSSALRLRVIEQNRPTIVCCTPTYALRLAEVAAEESIDLSQLSVRALIVAGEPGGGIPATRQRIEQAWGARVFDHWGMTEIASLGIESERNPGGLYLLETECICEIVSPHTLEPVVPGEEGELIITNLGRTGSPLIRYRTGDLVRAATGTCPDGYQLLRLENGILGRADDMLIIRGNNIYPSSLEAILRSFPDVAEYRIIAETRRSMQHLRIEIEPSPAIADNAAELLRRIADDISKRLHFRAEVALVPVGSLPRFELKGRRFVRNEDPADRAT